MQRLNHHRPSGSSLSRRGALILGVAAALFSGVPRAAEPAVNPLKNSLYGGRTDTAIKGYDPVAYFTEGKSVKGQDNLAADWMGAKWKFSSQANLARFKSNPEKYALQYGGYCAYGVTQVAQRPSGLHPGCRRQVSEAPEEVRYRENL